MRGQVDDRRFDPDGARPAVHDEPELMAHGLDDVFSGGWGEGLGRIGAGGCERKPARLDHLLHDGMGRPAQAHGRSASGDRIGNDRRSRQDHRQGPRPERPGQPVRRPGPFGCAPPRHLDSYDMHDDRIPPRASFELEEAGDGVGACGIGCQPIDRFGGQSHGLALSQQLCRPGDRAGPFSGIARPNHLRRCRPPPVHSSPSIFRQRLPRRNGECGSSSEGGDPAPASAMASVRASNCMANPEPCG